MCVCVIIHSEEKINITSSYVSVVPFVMNYWSLVVGIRVSIVDLRGGMVDGCFMNDAIMGS